MKFRFLILPVLLLLLSACAKPIEKSRLDYVGEWRSPEMALLILADGSVAYKRIKNGMTTSVNGPLKEFDGDDFIVGVGFFTTTFDVSEPPHEVEGHWQMVVDGVRLIRVDHDRVDI
jgi:hypothetical protein